MKFLLLLGISGFFCSLIIAQRNRQEQPLEQSVTEPQSPENENPSQAIIISSEKKSSLTH